MNGPMRRLRFGAILALAVLSAAFLAEPAEAGPVPPPTFTGLAAGQVQATSFQILGQGGSLGTSALFGRTLACAPCAIKVAVRESALVVATGGATGLLPGEKTYTLANFVGSVGVTRLGDANFVLTLNGGLEAIREEPPQSL